MDFTKADNNQLETIIKHEYDCPLSLLRGVVVELLNRGYFDNLIAKCINNLVKDEKQLERKAKVSFEDFMQIGRLEVYKALDTFKPNNGQKFTSYVYRSTACEVMNTIKLLFSAKRDCNKVVSYQNAIESDDTFEKFLSDRKQNVERYVVNKITAEQLLSKLNERQTKVVMYRLKGYTFEEIGKVIGRNSRTAHKVMKSALETMREGA